MTFQKAVLATLIYHDLFSFPLKLEEINRFQIELKSTVTETQKTLNQLIKKRLVDKKNEYYYLIGSAKSVALRTRRKKSSDLKLKKALFLARILKAVPSLRLVAISGALAMENSDKGDDIDLVLVSSTGLLWTTRFIANILLLPLKRDPSGVKVANRACLNVIIDESDLKIRPDNLYLAHEVAQMKPLWDRCETYDKFIKANGWVKKYLPNWQPSKVESGKLNMKSSKKKKFSTVTSRKGTRLAQFLNAENFFKSFQLWYMRSKITTEKITKTQVFFHPHDTKDWVLKNYQKRLLKLKI